MVCFREKDNAYSMGTGHNFAVEFGLGFRF